MRQITIRGKQYPLTVSGQGPIPCLVPGSGTLALNTLSPVFKQKFTIYATDLYWHAKQAVNDVKSLTVDAICQDVIAVAEQLSVRNYVLFGHSAFGILATEIARRDAAVGGALLVASPTSCSLDVANLADHCFEAHASADRKANDQQRRQNYLAQRRPDDSALSLAAYASLSARIWANYQISDETLAYVWQGMQYDPTLVEHFWANLMAKHSLVADSRPVKAPLLLLAGPYDFDSIPLRLWESNEIAEHFAGKLTVAACQQSGHWPHLEEPITFDGSVFTWLAKIGL